MIKGIIIAIIIGVIVYNVFGGTGLLIVGGIVVVGGIIFYIIGISGGSSSSSSSRYNSSSSVSNHLENRKNYPGKCISCTYYLSRGVCRKTGNPTSDMDSCSNWE